MWSGPFLSANPENGQLSSPISTVRDDTSPMKAWLIVTIGREKHSQVLFKRAVFHVEDVFVIESGRAYVGIPGAE